MNAPSLAVSWPNAALSAVLVGVALLALRYYMRKDYGPEVLALDEKRPKWLRVLVYWLVLPLRILGGIFSAAVFLLIVAILGGFAWIIWRGMHG